MQNIGKEILGAIVATAVMSALMLMKDTMSVMPQLDVIQLLSMMMGVSTAMAWVVHFMIGAIWGLLFARAYNVIPGCSALA
ncbi:MAG: hypothetical protein M3485_07345 [Pseudomonadota bacterium]|nr:hypothetical protein [Pseudomonadota bacterium]